MRRTLLMVLFVSLEIMASRAGSNEKVGPEEIFALIVGNNASFDSSRLPLRYADDDALQNWQLMTQLAPMQNVMVLTVPDKETRGLYGHVPMTPPTRHALEKAMAMLNQRMEAARQNGRLPIFYFFYTGHGDVKNNEGYMTLADGRFSRTDLLSLLKASRADRNHVVIDACKSYFMVYARGTGGRRRPATFDFVSSEQPLPQNTGFFLSTSSGTDSHEWEAFQGGIFSHEMRSALRGAADVDGDRAITYEEAAAFVWRANAAIPVERFRPMFFTRPPGNAAADRSVLADLRGADGTWMSVGYGHPEHQYLEDGYGRRLLDFHPAPRVAVAVLLPTRRPLFVRFPATGRELRLPEGDVIDISGETGSPWQVSARGAEHEAFAHLFSLSFEKGTIAAYRLWTREAGPVDVPHADRTWLRRGIGIGGLLVGGVGMAMTGMAIGHHRRIDAGSSGVAISDANQQIKAYNIAAVVCYGVAGAALTTYIVWRLWPKRSARLSAALLPPAALSIGGSF